MNSLKLFLSGLACAGLCGCDRLEDNGVHMADCLKDGAATFVTLRKVDIAALKKAWRQK